MVLQFVCARTKCWLEATFFSDFAQWSFLSSHLSYDIFALRDRTRGQHSSYFFSFFFSSGVRDQRPTLARSISGVCFPVFTYS